MKQKRIFCKRLLTLLLCLAMVFTSVNIPSFTVQAAVENKHEAKETDTLKNGATYDAETGEVTFYLKTGDSCYDSTVSMWYKGYGSYEEAEKNYITEGGNFIATEGVITADLKENEEKTEKSVTVAVSEGTAAFLYYFNASGGRPDYEHIIVIDEDDDDSDEAATEEQKADLTTLAESERKIVDAGNKEEYTEDSWAVYVAAVEKAEAVLANNSATVKEVNAALKALQDAKSGLTKEGGSVVTPEPDTSAGAAINFAKMEEAGNINLYVGGAAGWGTSAASYTIGEDGTSITVNCTNIGYEGQEWQIQLELLNKILKANETYQISFKIESNSNKMVHFKVADHNDGNIIFADKNDISLTAGVPQTIIVNTTAPEEDYTSSIYFALGNYGSDVAASAANITISDLKVYSAEAGDAEGGYPEPAENADIERLTKLYDEELAFSRETGNEEKYTTKTWISYTSAIGAAAALLEKAKEGAGNVTKQQVNKAYDDLTAARNALKVDLSKITRVIISEQEQQAFVGKPVVLTYVANKADFNFEGHTVKVNGKTIEATNVTIDADNSTITIAADEFQTAGVYTILFEQEGITFSPVYQTVYAENDKWNLIWQDEFDGDQLNSENWDYQTGNGSAYGISGWGNNEAEDYTKNNAAVSNGTLTITAKKEGNGYTSARIRTVTEEITDGKAGLGKALQIGTYGKIEAKIKMPAGDGIWPAFWMLPYDSEYGTWAASGEIDIMEARGRLTDTVCGTLHYGGVPDKNVYKGKDYYFNGSDITDYHIYAVEWDPDEIRWLVDGVVYNSISDWYAIADEEGNWPYPAPFDEEFYLLLNLAVGGDFDPDAEGRIDVDEEGVDMDVDYVRWYQRDQSVYDEWEITGPKIQKDNSENANKLLEMADDNGNFIKDADFRGMNTTPRELNQTYGEWFPLLNPGGASGGAATWSKVSEDAANYLKVSVTNTGNQAYAVQMLQYFPMVKGYSYEISYDAYTDTANSKADVSLKIGGDGERNYAAYSPSYVDDLTTKPTTYTHRFIMSADTDPIARFEFNLATSAGNVYLSNVCVKILEDGYDESEGEDDPKNPKSDGNHIYNGNFNIGSDSLLYWHWSENDPKDVVKSAGKAADGNGRAAEITVGNSPVSIWQYGINLLQNDDYELTFKVNTTNAQSVTISLTDKDGKVTYAEGEKDLSAGDNAVVYIFTQPEGVTDENAKLTLTFEKSAKLSSVKMIRTSYNNVDWDGVTLWPIYNGDFSNGDDGWNIWSEVDEHTNLGGWEQHTINDKGELEMDISAMEGANFWCVGIESKAMVLEKGMKWRVKFDYTLESEKTYVLELAGEQRDITLEAGTHTYISDPFIGSGNCSFKLFPGKTPSVESYKFILDNVVVYLDESISTPDGHEKPVSLVPDGKGKAGSPVVVKYTENPAAWGDAEKTYYINGEEIEASKVTEDKVNRKLTIDGSCFPEAGVYQFAVKAEGYERTVPINLTVLDKSGNLVVNGDFSLGDTAWGFYSHNGGACGAFSVNDDNVAVITYNSSETDWHIQLYQEGIDYEAGDYVICFDAWADVERPIGVQLQTGNDILPNTASTVSLSTGKTRYKVVLKGLEAKSGVKLDFPMGAVNGDATPNENHNIYIDNVVFRPATENDVSGKVNMSILGNLLKDYADAKEDESFSEIYAAAEAVYNNMDATQDEVNKAVEELKAGYLVVTKAELARILDAYKNVTGDETDEKYQAFKEAYDEAVTVSEKEDATLTEIEKAISDLKKAYVALAGVDKSLLTQTLEKYEDSEKYKEEDYTAESWAEFAKALKDAKAVAAKADATQKEVDDALAALEAAANALAEAGEEPGPGPEKKEGLWIAGLPEEITYTGAAIKPVIQVYDGETLLKEKTDYTVTYKKNTNVGTAEVIVKGKGNYAKTHTETFDIVPKNIADEDIIAPDVYAILSKNGTVKTPKISLKYGKNTLKAAAKTKENDYSAKFETIPTNEDGKLVAGHYTITVTGHGNYTGTREIGYDVLPNDIVMMNKVTVGLNTTSINFEDYLKDGVPQVWVESVTYGKGANLKELESPRDFVVSYEYRGVGKAAVVLTATSGSGYYGSKSVPFTVTGTAFKAKDFEVQGISAEGYTYTGSPIKVDGLTVLDKNNQKVLVKGTDYDVTYSKNTNAGKATITLTGMGGYTGKFTTTFNITKMDLGKKNEEDSGLVWTCEDSAVYTKNKAVPEYTLTYNGTPLTEKKDYKVTCKKNTAVTSEKTAEITITGIGNFTGTISETYAVTTPDASSIYAVASDVTVPKAVNKLKASLKVYEESTGKALKAGTDYEKTFEYYVLGENGEHNDVTADDLQKDTLIHATITLKGNYAGSGENATIETTFRLYETKASKLTVDKIPMQEYTGKKVEPPVAVYADKAKTQPLTKDVDYKVEYSNNVKKGTAKVTITGIGNGYGGVKTVTFKIGTKSMAENANWFSKATESITNFFKNLF